MTPLRKAFSELDNALPDSIFDYDLDQATVNKDWDEIEKAEQLMAKGEIADKYIKKWKK